jgi:hypothetical protein
MHHDHSRALAVHVAVPRPFIRSLPSTFRQKCGAWLAPEKSPSLCVSRGVCTRTSGVKGQRRVMLGAARIRAVCLPHVAMMSAEHKAPIPSRVHCVPHTQLDASWGPKVHSCSTRHTAIQRASCTQHEQLISQIHSWPGVPQQ